MRLILFVVCILILFAAGCSTEQLHTTQAITHSIAYPVDSNGMIIIDPNDPNAMAVAQIVADVEKILASKSSYTGETVINTVAPIVGTFGGWTGFAAMIALAIYNSRKKKI
jgi:hypothetical protein